jgi:hypothetical protein
MPVTEPGRYFPGIQHKRGTMIITPTVGRVVWYTPADGAPEGYNNGGQPFAALVAYVHSDRMVNLAVFDHNGVAQSRTSVPLVQEGDPKSVGGYYCEWMPYQIGQAKKHAS